MDRKLDAQARCLIGKERQQLGASSPGGRIPDPPVAQPNVAVRLPVVDRRERLEDGGDEDRAEGVGFDLFAIDRTGRARPHRWLLVIAERARRRLLRIVPRALRSDCP